MNKRVSKMLRNLATIDGEIRKDILKELKAEWKKMNKHQKVITKGAKENESLRTNTKKQES